MMLDLVLDHGFAGGGIRVADLVMPRVEVVATAPNYGRFAIGPLEKGYGLILGNALRRILLSSLPGAAVTSTARASTAPFHTLRSRRSVQSTGSPGATGSRPSHPNDTARAP